LTENPCTRLIAALGRVRQNVPALAEGDYRELYLTTRQYVFARTMGSDSVIVAVNNDANPAELHVPAEDGRNYIGVLSGQKKTAADHFLTFTISGNSGEIWVPEGNDVVTSEPVLQEIPETPRRIPAEGAASTEKKTVSASEKNVSEAVVKPAGETAKPAADIPKPTVPVPSDRPYEEMTVEELQSAILEKMAKNGPVTDRMMRDVTENIWHDSLVSWVKSFR
jgi:hypothetical protein